jgi:pyruvate formate lyase activating enzyme
MTSIYGYLEKPTMVDFPRHLAALFFTSGCNFRCGFCHNATLMGKQQNGLTTDQLNTACTHFKKQWANGVVISGGEPTLAPDLIHLIHLFKSHGFAIKLDTNGSNPDQLAQCLPLVDYVAMDLKTAPNLYPALTGFKETPKIIRSIELIRSHAKDYEFRTTIIQSHHTDPCIHDMRPLITGAKRYILQPFIPRDTLPDPTLAQQPRTPRSRLQQIKTTLQNCADEILLRGA